MVTDVVDAVNDNADELKGPDGCGAAGPADLVIELVHEGAASTAYAAVTDNSTFGQIVAGANENVDAIVSGHTHLAYNHKVPVQAWIERIATSPCGRWSPPVSTAPTSTGCSSSSRRATVSW